MDLIQFDIQNSFQVTINEEINKDVRNNHADDPACPIDDRWQWI